MGVRFLWPILLVGELGSDGVMPADYINVYTPVKALLPLERSRVMIAKSDEDVLSRIVPVPGQPCAFRTGGLVKPADVTLTAFFRVHFQRYAVYWRLTDLAQWEVQERRIAEGTSGTGTRFTHSGSDSDRGAAARD